MAPILHKPSLACYYAIEGGSISTGSDQDVRRNGYYVNIGVWLSDVDARATVRYADSIGFYLKTLRITLNYNNRLSRSSVLGTASTQSVRPALGP